MNPDVEFQLLLVAFLGLALACVKPLGLYIANVMQGRASFATRLGGRLEAGVYRATGVRPGEEMGWARYASLLLLFNVLGAVVVYVLQRLQAHLPLNPAELPGVSADSAFNTAVSFVTNTDWQGYSGESTLGALAQMAALAVQNFLSAASGLVVAIVLIRGFARHGAKTLGNVWVDLTRATLYVLLPLAFGLALVLASQGVIQNFEAGRTVTTLEPARYDTPRLDADGHSVTGPDGQALTDSATRATQVLPMGPIASQEAIKELGTNGGGYLNANSAHPFENPTPFTNFLELLAIFVIPLALTYTFGYLVGDPRQGWALLAAMLLLFLALAFIGHAAEQHGNPLLAREGVDLAAGPLQSGGNMEGKETRFGIAESTLFAAVTTATSCGAVNAMHDSLMPLGGLVPLFLIQLGELAPGGVGTGLYTMLVFAILGVFIAGLMIGRTPEYLGKKLEAREMKLAAVFILVTPVLVLAGTALAVSLDAGKAGVANPGAHGFSEILYAFSSAANNNGSAFGGLSANTPFYNLGLGIAMFVGRFWPIVAVLGIAGSLAAKTRIPPGEGTMPTHGPLFVSLLIGAVLLVGVLTFVPALALGPVAEHLQLTAHP